MSNPFWRCGTCRVKLQVSNPRYSQETERAPHFTKCICGLRYWHGSTHNEDNTRAWATVGATPEDLKAHKPNAEVLG